MRTSIPFAVVCALVPALAWAESATVPSGAKTQIVVHNSADSQCTPRPVEISVLTPPAHGTVLAEPKDVVIRPVTPRGGQQPSPCVGKTVAGVAVFYQSTPGFVGTDSFRYRRTSAGNDRSNGEISYTITVVAAQGQAPTAPAPVVQAPAVPQAQAQPASGSSIKAIFEKYDLIGTFAWDCSKPPDRANNWYFVNRVIDDDHIQRDFMESPTSRLWFAILDKARENGPGEIFLSGTRDGKYSTDGVWRIDKGRMQQWIATQEGKKLIEGGRYVATGKDLPVFTKCGSPSTTAADQAQAPVASVAQTQLQASASSPITALFEKYGLIGIFAADCSKPASNDNRYFVNRVIDAGHVQRDEMSGPTTRDNVSVLDKASALGPSEVSVAGMRDDQTIEGIWRVEGGRQIGTEVTIGGKKRISNARYVGGSAVPWLSKCGE
jgi:hypothetical protein